MKNLFIKIQDRFNVRALTNYSRMEEKCEQATFKKFIHSYFGSVNGEKTPGATMKTTGEQDYENSIFMREHSKEELEDIKKYEKKNLFNNEA